MKGPPPSDAGDELRALLGQLAIDVDTEERAPATVDRSTLVRRAIELVKASLRSDLRPRPGRREAPIILAARSGDASLMRALLDAGSDPNARGLEGTTALIDAARIGEREVVAMLLEAGSDPRAASSSGTTALINACAWGDPAVIDLLLDAGADPSPRAEHGQTALRSVVGPFTEQIRRRLIAAIKTRPDHVGRPAVRARGGKGKDVAALRGTRDFERMIEGMPRAWILLAVEAAVEDVARCLAERAGARWERTDRPIEAAGMEYGLFVFRLLGQRWTIGPRDVGAASLDGQRATIEDAIECSRALSTRAVVYSGADDLVQLELYEDGERVASLYDDQVEEKIEELGLYVPACHTDHDGLYVWLDISGIHRTAVERTDFIERSGSRSR